MVVVIQILPTALIETAALHFLPTNVGLHGPEIRGPTAEYHHLTPGYHQDLRVDQTGEEAWMDRDQMLTETEKEIAIVIASQEVEGEELYLLQVAETLIPTYQAMGLIRAAETIVEETTAAGGMNGMTVDTTGIETERDWIMMTVAATGGQEVVVEVLSGIVIEIVRESVIQSLENVILIGAESLKICYSATIRG